MENSHKKHIEDLETNVNKMLAMLKKLKEENSMLEKSLFQKSEDLKQAHREILNLRDERQAMETAKGFADFGGDTEAAKKHLNSLVREIDRCLALLKV